MAGAKPTITAKDRVVDAFWKYAVKYPVTEITVDTLARTAGCSRTTLYYHYEDINAIFDEAIRRSELFKAIERIASSDREFTVADIGNGFGVGEGFLNDLCTLAWLNVSNGYQQRLRVLVFDKWSSLIAGRLGEDELDFEQQVRLLFFVNGFVGLLAARGGRGNQNSWEEIAGALSGLFNQDLYDPSHPGPLSSIIGFGA